jgi:hypothetical protein
MRGWSGSARCAEWDNDRSNDVHEGRTKLIDASIVEQPAKAVLDAIGVEVEEEAHPAAGEASVGQRLELDTSPLLLRTIPSCAFVPIVPSCATPLR